VTFKEALELLYPRPTPILRPSALGTGNPSSIPVALSYEGEMPRSGSLQTRRHFGVDLCLLHILRDGGGSVSLCRPHHPSCYRRPNHLAPVLGIMVAAPHLSPPSRGRHPRRRRPPPRAAHHRAHVPPRGPPSLVGRGISWGAAAVGGGRGAAAGGGRGAREGKSWGAMARGEGKLVGSHCRSLVWELRQPPQRA
jgi:hypothetical protein